MRGEMGGKEECVEYLLRDCVGGGGVVCGDVVAAPSPKVKNSEFLGVRSWGGAPLSYNKQGGRSKQCESCRSTPLTSRPAHCLGEKGKEGAEHQALSAWRLGRHSLAAVEGSQSQARSGVLAQFLTTLIGLAMATLSLGKTKGLAGSAKNTS